MGIIQWWQSASAIDIATVGAAIVGVIALIWAVFVYFFPRGGKTEGDKIIAKNQSIAAGRDVTIGSPSDKA